MSSRQAGARTPSKVDLRRPVPRGDSTVEFRQEGDEVLVVLGQAFGPKGDSLIGISEVTFDGHPALTLKVRAAGREGLTHISPIHGDSRKSGFVDIDVGTKCELLCPVSGEPLLKLPPVSGDEATDYFALFLTPELSEGAVVGISDVWGHYHSRVVDNFELISAWLESEPGLD
jgi:hypothetical protein